MNTAQKLARYGSALALALALALASTPAFAQDDDDGDDDGQPTVAPFVVNTVNDGIQTAAGATAGGLNVGGDASGEPGLNIGADGVNIGAGAVGTGLGIPSRILGGR
jgi:hypothetical protein